jgi:hypothetical protein
MRNLVLLLPLCAAPALAQGADAGTGGSDLERALDAAAAAPSPAAPAAATPNPVARFFQSLNPDLAVIVDANAGVTSGPSYSLAGDDPDLKGGPADAPAGFTLQEIELALGASVDPYLRGDVFFAIPNLEGFEVEEAFATTTGLPFGLQAKGGIFRSGFGRQNGRHLHQQDFTKRPLLNAAYLGADGLRAPGAQLSWLAPLPFFLQLTAEAYSVPAPEELEQLNTFGGGARSDLTWAAQLDAFGAFSDAFSVYGGLSAATGMTAGVDDGTGTVVLAGARTVLEGADLYLKYKPPNVAGGFFSLAWTTEYFVRQVLDVTPIVDGGLYTQLLLQLDRRWFLGARLDLLGLPASPLQPRVSRTALSIGFEPSEFSRIRLYGERETQPGDGEFFLAGPSVYGAFLQLEVSIGAHGAHPF